MPDGLCGPSESLVGDGWDGMGSTERAGRASDLRYAFSHCLMNALCTAGTMTMNPLLTSIHQIDT